MYENPQLLPDWFRLVDMLNTGNLIVLHEPEWARDKHSMQLEVRQIWERDDGEGREDEDNSQTIGEEDQRV